MKPSGLRLPIEWGAKLVNRTPAHVAKLWMPVDFMVCAVKRMAPGTTVIIR